MFQKSHSSRTLPSARRSSIYPSCCFRLFFSNSKPRQRATTPQQSLDHHNPHASASLLPSPATSRPPGGSGDDGNGGTSGRGEAGMTDDRSSGGHYSQSRMTVSARGQAGRSDRPADRDEVSPRDAGELSTPRTGGGGEGSSESERGWRQQKIDARKSGGMKAGISPDAEAVAGTKKRGLTTTVKQGVWHMFAKLCPTSAAFYADGGSSPARAGSPSPPPRPRT